MSNNNILIVATHGLGDLVMLLPALNSCDFSNCNVSIILKGNAEKDVLCSVLLKFKPEIFMYSQHNSLYSKYRFIKKLRLRKYKYIVPQVGVSSKKYMLFMLLLRKSCFSNLYFFFRILSIRKADNAHKVTINYRVFSLLPFSQSANGTPVYPYVNVSEMPIEKSLFIKPSSIMHLLISPGSGEIESHKRWPENKYVSLINQLLDTQKNIVISVVGSPSESTLLSNIKKRCRSSNRLQFYPGSLKIKELINKIHSSDLVLSNCNGVSHLSALCQRTVVGLYGPTDPNYTGPFGVRIVPILLNYDCSPCYKQGYIQGCGNPVCMQNISVSQVYSVVLSNLIK